MTHPDLIGSRDACAILKVDRATLSRWVGAGKITPVVKLPEKNGAMLFAVTDIARLARDRVA